ncbi:HAMP domain-containing sensor histidine kinase [Catelliglobosispora koreensis]|uniref:HAMP domain-containing sensor histidine kinase n=1 Tax=Catelliglobosispora koreensis TaxID=129052 RepID=UPI00036C495D|nr:HAMP domain-containing sensor histidine kinase [Catelliglobosispora koreensis]
MTRRRSISGRLTLIAAAAVTLVAIAVGVLALLALRETLTSQADRELQHMARGPIRDLSPTAAAQIPPSPLEAPQDLRMQIKFPGGGSANIPRDTAPLPWTAADQAVADGQRSQVSYTTSTDEGRFRILTVKGSDGQTVQLAKSLQSADATLRRLAMIVAGLIAGAAIIAGLAGRLIARAGLRPVSQLTTAATRIAETRDLSEPIPVTGDDEIATLAQAFNNMLSRLGDAQRQQRDLIEDAAHELRTPMASMRTNIELLIHAGNRLADNDKTALLADLNLQSTELADLVASLVDLARSETVEEPATQTELSELTASAIGLAETHFPQTVFRLHAPAAVTIQARPGTLQRAIVNLLDNAAKFGPEKQTIDIHLSKHRDGTAQLSVLDQNPVIPENERTRIFQRFHRLDTARAIPGSGLGLAIAHQAATTHQGTITVHPRPGGGNEFRLTITGAAR